MASKGGTTARYYLQAFHLGCDRGGPGALARIKEPVGGWLGTGVWALVLALEGRTNLWKSLLRSDSGVGRGSRLAYLADRSRGCAPGSRAVRDSFLTASQG
ncbi:MAG: hypothetical protein ACFCVA_02785 [Gammaproteobacteria bacterium]